jgi:hypothetical protein
MMSVFLAILLTLRTWAHSRVALQLENLALRRQLQVRQRTRPRRLRLAKTDRARWATVASRCRRTTARSRTAQSQQVRRTRGKSSRNLEFAMQRSRPGAMLTAARHSCGLGGLAVCAEEKGMLRYLGDEGDPKHPYQAALGKVLYNEIIRDDGYLLRKFFKTNDDPVSHVVDIGANIGYFTLLATTLFPESQRILIEPNPDIVKLLTVNF